MPNDECQPANQKSEIKNQKSYLSRLVPRASRLAPRPSRLVPRASRLVPRAFALLLCLAAVGCGSSDGRLTVRGTATLNGQPLSSASVSFRPIDHNAPTAGTSLVDGKFTIPADHGLLPGRYAVRFEAFQPTGRKVKSPEVGMVDEVKFVEISSVDPAEVTVVANAENSFTFRLVAGQ